MELLVRFHNDPNWEEVIMKGVPMRKVGTEEESPVRENTEESPVGKENTEESPVREENTNE